jgi:hypothetical protein
LSLIGGDEYHREPEAMRLKPSPPTYGRMAVVSKIDEYRARAVSCERRAKKTRNEVDREWQMTLARAFLMLAEAEAERDRLNVIRFDRHVALGNPADQ